MQLWLRHFTHETRKHARYYSLFFIFVILIPTVANGETYDLDHHHSLVRMEWDRMGVSRQSGRFNGVQGILEFYPDNLEKSSVRAVINATTLNTGVSALNHVLSTEMWFDTANYPKITFHSKKVRLTGPRTAIVTGDLTVKKTTLSVDLDVKWNFSGPHPYGPYRQKFSNWYISGFSGKTTISRSAFGLDFGVDIDNGVTLVGDKIDIQIEVEAIRRE